MAGSQSALLFLSLLLVARGAHGLVAVAGVQALDSLCLQADTVCVQFTKQRCRACRSARPKFERLEREFAVSRPGVRFAELYVDAEENRAYARRPEMPNEVPYVKVFHGTSAAACVGTILCGPSGEGHSRSYSALSDDVAAACDGAATYDAAAARDAAAADSSHSAEGDAVGFAGLLASVGVLAQTGLAIVEDLSVELGGVFSGAEATAEELAEELGTLGTGIEELLP